MTWLQRHVDLVVGLAALAYAAVENTGVLQLGLADPGLAAGVGLASLARWYAGVRRRAKQHGDQAT
jgi:hypothetical protein